MEPEGVGAGTGVPLRRRTPAYEYDDVDERVTEVAAPSGAAMDVMRIVDS